jgi:hypothetical protein
MMRKAPFVPEELLGGPAITCLNDGDEFGGSKFQPATPTHRVRTSTQVVRQDGDLALRLSAECPCGWSQQTTITANGEKKEDR